MPCPMNSRTTPSPCFRACRSMALPMACTGWPGPAAAIPSSIASRVSITKRRSASDTSPTARVTEESPCTPSRKIVTSTLTMSPSANGRLSGIPWQITSLTEVHTDFG